MLYLGTTHSGAKRVRELIVVVLAEEFPSTIPRLRRALSSRFGVRVTYQALHKELVTLRERGIAVRDENGVRLRQDWIARQREFFRYAHVNYERAPPAPIAQAPRDEVQVVLTDY